MNGARPLAQLRDIHLPDPIGWWPPAPGWWLLAALVIATAVAGGYLLRKRIAGNRYRKLALADLERRFRDYSQHHRQQRLCQQVLEILRRCLLNTGSDLHNRSAGQLLQALNRQPGKPPFPDQLIARIDQLAYAPNPTALDKQDLASLQQSARLWIRQHQRETP